LRGVDETDVIGQHTKASLSEMRSERRFALAGVGEKSDHS
jgi:hypothetical protein